jgi:TonB family protein
MRPLCFFVLSLTALLPGLAQTAANSGPGLPKDPRAIFEAAAPFYDFDSPELKPWHLKATYQIYDEKGTPSEQGTYEYWWASPKIYRSTWTRPGVSFSDWHTAEGTSLRQTSGSHLKYFERTINSILLFSLPGRAALESGRMKLELNAVPTETGELACVSSIQQWEQDGKLQTPSSSAADNNCFDPSTFALRISYFNSIRKEFSQIVTTQGRYLPRNVVASYGKQRLFTVSVDSIDGLKPDDAALPPPLDAVLDDQASCQKSESGSWPPCDVKSRALVKRAVPSYPFMAKAAHEQGTVVLAGVIGTNGGIRDLEVLTSPSSRLSHSAMNAVEQWEYKPYMLNGKPVKVETTINVIYALSK